MTKSLTEQLNNGTLKDGVYYIKDNDNILIGLRYSLHMTRLIDDGCSSVEVLDTVPSYDEYQALLSDQLSKIEGVEITEELKAENKKLKEQLEEGKEVIKYYAGSCIGEKQEDGTMKLDVINKPYIVYDPRPAQSYLKRWGVK